MSQVPIKIFQQKTGLPKEAVYWLIERELLPLSLDSSTLLKVDLTNLDLDALFKHLSGSDEFRRDLAASGIAFEQSEELQKTVEKIVSDEFTNIIEEVKEIWATQASTAPCSDRNAK